MTGSNDARHLALRPEGITSVPERGELRAGPVRVRTVMFRSVSCLGASGPAAASARRGIWRCRPAGRRSSFGWRRRLRSRPRPPCSAAISIPFPMATVIGSSCSAIRSATACGQASIAPSRTTPTLEFINRSKPSTGFARPDSYDWNNELGEHPQKRHLPDRGLMFGANDAQPIKSGKDLLKVGSEGWHEVYGQRVEAFIKKLRAANIAVYWVGLPIMRSADRKQRRRSAERCVTARRPSSTAPNSSTPGTASPTTAGRYSAYGPGHDRAGQAAQGR